MDYESLYSTATKALNTQLEINDKLKEANKHYLEVCLENQTLTKRIEELETAKTIGIQACDLLKERIKELEEIYLGQIRVVARSRITYKEKVERMVTLAEQALKGE